MTLSPAFSRLVRVGRRTAPMLWWRVLALIILVAAWQLTSLLAGGGFLPTPVATLDTTGELLAQSSTFETIAVTARRVAIAAIASAVLGMTLGAVMALSRYAEAFFLPSVLVTLAIPGPVYVIMAVIILGVGETSTMLALIVSVTPFATNITFQGVKARDPKIDEMASVYGIAHGRWVRDVLVPQIAPALLGAGRTAFALSWKLVVIMEALSTSNGVGAELVRAFKLLRPEEVVSYVALFMVIMLIVEMALFRPAERTLVRWQSQVGVAR